MTFTLFIVTCFNIIIFSHYLRVGLLDVVNKTLSVLILLNFVLDLKDIL